MTSYGYTLMTEQSGPREIVRYAAAGEQAGFDFEVMSDHYSPWLDEQGHAAYAWSMLGAVSHGRLAPKLAKTCLNAGITKIMITNVTTMATTMTAIG